VTAQVEVDKRIEDAIKLSMTPHRYAARVARHHLVQRIGIILQADNVRDADVQNAVRSLVDQGIVEEVPAGYQLTAQGLRQTREEGADLTGTRVKVHVVQPKRMGPPQYPGRTGTVLHQNQFGKGILAAYGMCGLMRPTALAQETQRFGV
jgi:hypothetical protein